MIPTGGEGPGIPPSEGNSPCLTLAPSTRAQVLTVAVSSAAVALLGLGVVTKRSVKIASG